MAGRAGQASNQSIYLRYYSCQDSHPKPAALNPEGYAQKHIISTKTPQHIAKFFCQLAALARSHMTKIKDCALCFVSDGHFFPQEGFFILQKMCS
jgi:hypothetical protein